MEIISGFASQIQIVASVTFPSGFLVSKFSQDIDAFDLANLDIAHAEMGANGDLVVWSQAQPIPIVLSVVPDSSDDINLGILWEANRVQRGKLSANDIITMVLQFSNGDTEVLKPGVITNGPPATGMANNSRLKTKTYSFNFEGKIGI
jgi:hypothetical protein